MVRHGTVERSVNGYNRARRGARDRAQLL
jgi:hypothetical protein